MNETFLRSTLALISLALVATRLHYGGQARRASPILSHTESRVSNTLLWALGIPAILISGCYILIPGWLTWSAVPLPLPVRWLGVGLGVLTVGLFAWVHRSLGHNWAMPLERRASQTLVTAGPYRWVRHPLYTTLFLWAGAYFLIAANWAVGLPWFTLALAAASLAPSEEVRLVERFGATYLAYQARTGRFLPRWVQRGNKS